MSDIDLKQNKKVLKKMEKLNKLMEEQVFIAKQINAGYERQIQTLEKLLNVENENLMIAKGFMNQDERDFYLEHGISNSEAGSIMAYDHAN